MKNHIFLTCLLIAMFLSGCGSTPTPEPTPVLSNNLADIINPPQPPSECIEINVSNTAPKVGEIITVKATLKNVVKPTYWGLEVKDEGADASSMLINLLASTPKAADISKIIKMTSAKHDETTSTIELEMISAGTTDVNYFVSAEDFCGTPLGNGVSARVKITANP
jgi:hypothetical protein